MKRSAIVWGLVWLFTCSGVAWSQTLADVARKEEARRKTVTAPSKTYTNDDLRRYPVTTPDPAPATAAAKPSGEGEKAAGAADAKGADTKDVAPSVDLGEEYWRKLAGEARGARARSTSYLQALESQIGALTTQFYALQDPAQRSATWSQRTRLVDDMERLKQDMADQDKVIAKIEEDARKANVPPGWIR
jgi:hypothetical protein